MAQLIFGHDEVLARWAEDRYPEAAPLSRPLAAVGIADDSGQELYGVAIFTGMSRTNVDLTMVTASKRWATKKTLRGLLYYPFVHFGLKRMTAFTSKKNRPARSALVKFGFKQEGVHPHAFPDGNTAISYGLYRGRVMEKWFNGERTDSA